MLVIENGHAMSAAFEDLDHLFEEFVARVKYLSLFILRVVAVLADNHHAVDRETACAERDGIRDAGEDGDVVTFGATAGEIAVWKLIDVERHEIGRGRPPFSTPGVSQRQAIDEMHRVHVLRHDSPDERNLFARCRRSCSRRRCECGGASSKERAASTGGSGHGSRWLA